jgi:hypothetical protein
MIKEFSKQYDTITLTIKDNGPLHISNIQRLFSSIKNVELTTETFHGSYDKVISSEWWFQQISPWFQNPRLPYTLGEDMIGDRFWYKLAAVPFYLKWDNFYFERDTNKEKEVFYDIFQLKDNQQFIFLHEDPLNKDADRTIKRKYISNNYRVIEFPKYPNVSILDILYTIEKAKEVHVHNTGLLSFIDLMNIQHNNLNYHKYTRPNPVEQAALRLNWKIIDE